MVAQNTSSPSSPSIFADFVSGISLEKLAELYSTTSIEIIKWFQQPQIQELYKQFQRFQRAQQLITERQSRIEAMKALAEWASHLAPNAESVRAAAATLRATSHLAANRPSNHPGNRKPRQSPQNRRPSVPHESDNGKPDEQQPDSSAASQTPRDPFSRIRQLDSNDLLVEFLPHLLRSETKRVQGENQSASPSTDHQPELSEPPVPEAIPTHNSS